MASRRTRLALVALLLLVAVAAIALVSNLRRKDAAVFLAQRDLVAHLEDLTSVASQVETAQHFYSAASADMEEQWRSNVPVLIQRLSDGTAAAKPLVQSPGAADVLQTIIEAASALMRVDARARQDLRSTGTLATSDLMAEARDILDSIRIELRGLRTAEVAAHEASREGLFLQSAGAIAAAALTWLAGLLFLARGPAVGKMAASTAGVGEAPAAPAGPPAEAPAGPVVDFAAAADVCAALTLITKASDLPPLLERAARVLDAPGAVVWIGLGDRLVPGSWCGYDSQFLDRLGPIPREADNAAAKAWRTGELQVVAGDHSSIGALAAPMVNAEGCVGVLTAEVRQGRERDPSVRSVAAIFAAQLASTVSAHAEEAESPTGIDVHPEASGM